MLLLRLKEFSALLRRSATLALPMSLLARDCTMCHSKSSLQYAALTSIILSAAAYIQTIQTAVRHLTSAHVPIQMHVDLSPSFSYEIRQSAVPAMGVPAQF